MISTLLTFSAVFALAQAAVSPLTPATTRAGDPIKIQWTPDTTGTWTDVRIQLMSGSNWDMVPVVDVAGGIDGTTVSEYDWTVPAVNPYSKIYFLQFTNNGADPTWSTRFLIESPTGESTDPVSSIEPDGQTIPWGNAALAGQPTSPVQGASVAPSGGSAVASSAISSASASQSSVSSSASAASASASASLSSASASITSAASSAQSSASRMVSSLRSAASSAAVNVVSSTSGSSQVQAGLAVILASVVGLLAIA